VVFQLIVLVPEAEFQAEQVMLPVLRFKVPPVKV